MEKEWVCSICGSTHGNNLPIPERKKLMRMVCKNCGNVTEHIRKALWEGNNNES